MMVSSSRPALLRNKEEWSTNIGSTGGNPRLSRDKIEDGRVWGGDAEVERRNELRYFLCNLEVL
jgi:hypothetical protein